MLHRDFQGVLFESKDFDLNSSRDIENYKKKIYKESVEIILHFIRGMKFKLNRVESEIVAESQSRILSNFADIHKADLLGRAYWLIRSIVRNICIDLYRKEVRRKLKDEELISSPELSILFKNIQDHSDVDDFIIEDYIEYLTNKFSGKEKVVFKSIIKNGKIDVDLVMLKLNCSRATAFNLQKGVRAKARLLIQE